MQVVAMDGHGDVRNDERGSSLELYSIIRPRLLEGNSSNELSIGMT
jgi:hypothetical protein